ncbi:MAG: hypothetical protein AABX33_00785 [Nanoarchaeota archaeon]
MKEQGNEAFFIQVKEPNEIRRNILETLKEIIQVLRRFENFKHTRHEKLERMHKLKGLLKDANKLFGNLKRRLPQTNLKPIFIEETPRPAAKALKKKKIDKTREEKTPKKEMTQLEKLETELGAIESKLKNLN